MYKDVKCALPSPKFHNSFRVARPIQNTETWGVTFIMSLSTARVKDYLTDNGFPCDKAAVFNEMIKITLSYMN
jgi:hypothetical protein